MPGEGNQNILALGLGSNLGDRKQYLDNAIHALSTAFQTAFESSSVYETEPWGVRDQPSFLNQVIIGRVNLPVNEVFALVHETEHQLGKSKQGHWQARNIDIDCLFYGSRTHESADWKLPHPGLHKRNFVLIPLLELVPDWIHPILKLSVEEMYWNCDDTSEVILIEGY